MSKAADDVLSERLRQIDAEGWTVEHDDMYDAGDLATAGACYALNAACVLHPLNGTPLELGDDNSFSNGVSWPWESMWWKPGTPRHDLVRAAALMIAEIERIDRESARTCQNGLTPDGPVCPRCGGRRGPSGVDGGSWVHY